MDEATPEGEGGCGGPRGAAPEKPPCCGEEAAAPPWQTGSVWTSAGRVPRVGTRLTLADSLGSCKARWGFGRMTYAVAPGLYAVGDPDPESPVFVTANYKMSFDCLRESLHGRNGWILVLDTNGINVWCAAGKGTFGTDELVNRGFGGHHSDGVPQIRLSEVVSHRTLILPQLGAPGIRAHEVRQRSGFKVVYGPVRAADLPAFLDANMRATPEMRRVRFTLRDRVVLIPIELAMAAKPAALIIVVFFILAGIQGASSYSPGRALGVGAQCAALFLAACLTGAAATPALLPWLPGRAFAAKGAVAGGVTALIVAAYACWQPAFFENRFAAAGWLLLIPALSSFLAMNFTGASTYTSLSGVRREMRYALPLQIAAGVLGAGLWIAGRFV